MDCRSFRQHHLAYVDDTLPGDLLVAAERHVVECSACCAHDTLVRRSLLLARNLPPVQCSADFDARLESRLAAMRCGRASAPPRFAADDEDAALGDGEFLIAARAPRGSQGWRSATPKVAAMAASLLLAAGAGVAWRDAHDPATVALPPVVASVPETGQAGQPDGGALQQATPGGGAGVQLAAAAPEAASAGIPDEVPPSGPRAETPVSLSASAMMVPASMGASVWPAAILAGEMPVELLRARVRASGARGQRGVTLVDLRR
ncbi:MAG TPA: hypothetical protein VEZ47_04425 [Gemmatirosa sp.]|nr:hypothetical protein [Gemmatirosa sp.]